MATPDRWLLVFLYSYQIYADFFGYSAIALGLGLLFGYRLPVNFDLPYISVSFSEFWTRWHISLSTWLRTYLYIPLGGNRKGPVRTCLNLMIVMTLGGLWHGASLSYALWGMLHGLLLVVERPFLKLLGEAGPVVRVVRMGVVFFCVTMLWIFFKLPNFDHALGYLSGMFSPTDNPNPTKLFRNMALLYALPVLIQHLGIGALLEGRLRRWEPYLYGALGGDGLARGRAGRRLHLFPVLTMPQASRLSWLIKCAGVAAALLLACGLATARFGSALQQPAVTTRDGSLITLNRYVREPTPDIVLVGSSVAWRLKEEYFSPPRVRNLALAGGSPVTGLRDRREAAKPAEDRPDRDERSHAHAGHRADRKVFGRRAHGSAVPAPGANGDRGL